MLSTLRRLLGGGGDKDAPGRTIDAPGDGHVAIAGHTLDLVPLTVRDNGFPYPDWSAVADWLDTLPDDVELPAWQAARRAWLCMLRDALPPGYAIHESDDALLLGAQPARQANTTLDYVGTSLKRVRRMLGALPHETLDTKEILVVFDDEALYYRYIAHFYGDEDGDEVAMSSGLHIGGAGHHFMTCDADLHAMEPVIVHELTHSCLRHLPIPAWLNEGMAVNAEQRVTRTGDDIYTVRELEAKHRAFWNEDTIQAFWSGAAYVRTDDGSRLAYDLGRVLVNGLAADWAAFERFAAIAHGDDAGAAAAREVFDLDLGDAVRDFLGRDGGMWSPRPHTWNTAPERGAFCPALMARHR